MDRHDEEQGAKQYALSERQERLLMKVADGNADAFTRYRGKLLLGKSASARKYLEDLRSAGKAARAAFDAEAAGGESDRMWEAVERRIAQEERAERLLGKRVLRDDMPRQTFGESLQRFSFDRVAWGLTGGALAASLTLFLIREPTSPSGSLPIQGTASRLALSQIAGPAVIPQPVSAGSIFPRGDRHVVEVDWMRSDGRVRLMQDPSERSAIIWVKRRTLPRFDSASRQRLAASGSVTPSLYPLTSTGR